jgi:UDP-N-acetylmuramoyl-L-alanyl-D-glutamate--2,6-diaminopimelate ligase
MRMRLDDLFQAAGLAVPEGAAGVEVTGVTDNSRQVEPGHVFAAIRGTHADGHLFISDAVERGAAVVITQQNIPEYRGVLIVQVPDSREALGRLAHAFLGNPARNMLTVGVTGTNGKTTTTYLMEAILRAAGRRPGVIGTIEYRYAGQTVVADNTTPSAVRLARLFAAMRDAGTDAVVMEVSSHALDQKRVAGIEFDLGIFTNLTQDHLDYHRTMEAYAEAKHLLFSHHLKPATGAAVFNVDDPCGRSFSARFAGPQITFAMDADDADVVACNPVFSSSGTRFTVRTGGREVTVNAQLLGRFNVLNITGALAGALAVGIPLDTAVAAVETVPTVRGRFEQVNAGQDFLVIVDYAHTPDALERVLTNAKSMTQGRLFVVFGCGGDRDRTKRPIMGRIAATLGDRIILTNDNPRTEDPQSIADMVYAGICEVSGGSDRARVILDRREAIGAAIAEAGAGDVIVIAGKGHENYQILGTTKTHFDDVEVAREFLIRRLGRPCE